MRTYNKILYFTFAYRSQWSAGHLPPLAIALCSGLFWPFQSSWSLADSVLLQCLASSCCEAGLSSSSPAGSRSGLGVWCWMLASWGCVRSSPTSSAVSAWPLVPVPLAPTDHFGSSPAVGFCRCASDRCWRMSEVFCLFVCFLFVCLFVCLFVFCFFFCIVCVVRHVFAASFTKRSRRLSFFFLFCFVLFFA